VLLYLPRSGNTCIIGRNSTLLGGDCQETKTGYEGVALAEELRYTALKKGGIGFRHEPGPAIGNMDGPESSGVATGASVCSVFSCRML